MNTYSSYYKLRTISLLLSLSIMAHKKQKQRAEYRKAIIKAHGYEHYLRDRTWHRIKERRKHETVAMWQKRLAIYGFNEYGKDLWGNEENTVTNELASIKDENNVFEKIYQRLCTQPGDFMTIQKHKWFFAFAANGNIYIHSSEKTPMCKINKTRILNKAKVDEVYRFYKQKKSIGATKDLTFNASYWFALFAAFGL